MKLLLCYRINEYSTKMSGVFEKFLGQVKGFAREGVETYAAFMSLSTLKLCQYDKGEWLDVFSIPNVAIEGEREIFWQHLCRVLKHETVPEFDVVYCRYDQMYDGNSLVSFLAETKRRGATNVVELPTYPYEKEISSEVLLNTDLQHRKQLAPHIDFYASTCSYHEIDGVDVFNFHNKIDDGDIGHDFSGYQFDEQQVNLIGLANISFWHGYDRLIQSMFDYRQKFGQLPFVFHIVGDGNEKQNLINLVTRLDLSDKVLFHGFKRGSELKNLLLTMDAGVDCLGLFRKAMSESSSLKARKYLAMGLPYITASKDVEANASEAAFIVKNTDEPIDLKAFLNFLKNTALSSKTKDNFSIYARDRLTWRSFSRNILQKITG